MTIWLFTITYLKKKGGVAGYKNHSGLFLQKKSDVIQKYFTTGRQMPNKVYLWCR